MTTPHDARTNRSQRQTRLGGYEDTSLIECATDGCKGDPTPGSPLCARCQG